METTEYQSRIEGLNGTALVLPLSAPFGDESSRWRCIGLAVVEEIAGHVWSSDDFVNVSALETRDYYAHSSSLMTVLSPVAGLKIR